MSDDWKGEHLISAAKQSREERQFTSRSVAARMAHKRRAEAGSNMSRAGGPWAVSINNWRINGLLEREGQ